jgi:hypothetical protein
MLECDNFGNNPLHFAFRSKNPTTVDLIIRAGYGDIDHRNQQGKTPKESAHNTVLLPQTRELLMQFDPTSQKPREADYLFVASAERYEVLTSQLESLKFVDVKTFDSNEKDSGSKIHMGSYIIYKHSQDPDKVIVLVFFDDVILNKTAEALGIRAQL